MDRQSRKHRLRADDIEGGRFRLGYLNRDVALPYVVVVHLHFFFEKVSAATGVVVDDVIKSIQS